jgi:mercuric ion binding protein
LIHKELVVKLITALMTVFMLWSANALAGEVHILLGVDGMSCPFCVYGIEKRLKKIDGIGNVRVDLAQGNIWVEASGADVLSENDARLLLQEAGFTLRAYEVHQGATHEQGENEHGKNEFGQNE